MKTDSNSAIKQIVGKARSVPFSGYLLILINAIMIAAFVCQDMTMHYLLGMIVFTVAIVVALAGLTGMFTVPTSLIG
jgi:hypothetical protein